MGLLIVNDQRLKSRTFKESGNGRESKSTDIRFIMFL